jgi:hypothetical protein
MNMNKIFQPSLIVSLFLSHFLFAQAMYAQDANQSLLITKLEKVSQSLADKDESKVAITLRLADLYSERARHTAMSEIEKGCVSNCNGAVADRAKALRLYTDILPRVPAVNKSKVIVQVGHLYQLNGQEDKALSFYTQIVNGTATGNISSDLKSEAHLSLAEIYFKRRDYRNASVHYKNIISLPSSNSKGLASYRNAWCSFNLGDHAEAIKQIETILSSPNLLSKSSLNGDKSDINVQFQSEVSKDYATFLTQKSVTLSDVKRLYQLSPESTRQSNVQYLAYELERVGKKSESLMAWNEALGTIANPEDKATAFLAIAQLNLDLQDKKSAIRTYEKALTQISELKKCEQSTNCDEYRKRARFFVVSWNQTEKKEASAELLQAYQLYLGFFKADTEMKSFAVSAAVSGKNTDLAWNLQNDIVNELSADLANPETAKQVKPDFLEKNLVQQLDLADTSGKVEYKNLAYNNYLKLSLQKSKTAEVQYQIAHQYYEKNNYTEAAQAFHKIALTKSIDMKIRKQAADLALDSLGLLKDTAQVVAYSEVYKNELGKNNAKDFSQILQKSKLSQSVELAGQSSEAAYAALIKINVSDLDDADKVKFYKNKIILAEKNKKISDAISACDSLVAIPQASAEDKEYAFSRKAYLSELRLDFASAFSATEKLAKTYTDDEKNLKLAMFSELSGGSSEAYYKKYLQSAASEENKKLVAVELVKKSKDKLKEIEKHLKILEKDPELLANLYAETYSTNASVNIYKKINQSQALKKTASGKLVLRSVFLDEVSALSTKISKHQLDTTSDKKLVSTLKSRKNLLDQVEAMAKSAIDSADWTSQLITLNLLSKQSERFYNDVISAPIPKGLNPDEEAQYLSLLSAQAMPYKNKAVEAQVKVEEFWKTPNWQSEFQKSLSRSATRRLVEIEVNAVSEIASAPVQTELKVMTSEATAKTAAIKPSIDEVRKTRQLVYAEPLNTDALAALLALEKRSENKAMVSYLENRIESLKKGL